ncbi:MAG TPA: DUF3025 domain-containing protein [Casimicrobium sp.]|nr:DUF3025 domain-containing protein [Casimicrobium sp.]
MASIADAACVDVVLAAIPDALAAHAAYAPYRPAYAEISNHSRRSGKTVTEKPVRAEPQAKGLTATHAASIPRLIPPPVRALGALDFERALVDRNELIVRPDNLHDTMNAIVWHTFPRTKRIISEIHVSLGAANTANGRPRRRDVLTLFDEAGAIIVSQRDDLKALHQAHEWKALFVEHRAEFQKDVRVILFGHGTLEQLGAKPHQGLTVKALWLPLAPSTPLPEIDAWMAERIANGALLATDEHRLPLPILGVPGWFTDNDEPTCYDDTDVFRPLRPKRASAPVT